MFRRCIPRNGWFKQELQQVHGRYGDLPRPEPLTPLMHFRQFNRIEWMTAGVIGLLASFVVVPVPIFALPFWSAGRKIDREADRDFGPERYGIGYQVASGGH